MTNLVQKCIIWSVDKEQFFIGAPFNYISSPSLARVYSNYSDAIMAWHSLNVCTSRYRKSEVGGKVAAQMFNYNNQIPHLDNHKS